MFATCLLPLAAPGRFTYRIPPALDARVCVGARVVVPFGVRHFYTAIITDVSAQAPQPEMKLKDIVEVVDDAPIVLPRQLALWQWMAQYYMCTEGEVMKAALPTGLKLESETTLVRVSDFEEHKGGNVALNDTERRILRHLDDERGRTILELEKELGERNLMRVARRLIALGAAAVGERMGQAPAPRTQTIVHLAPEFFDETRLHEALDGLHRAPAQQALLLRYLDLAEASAALTLQNFSLLKTVTRRELCADDKGRGPALAALIAKGILLSEIVRAPQETPGGELPANLSLKPLSPEQERALGEIHNFFEKQRVCLLHGVTSSGKTEVYMHLIREAIDRGEQVLYLVPEIALTTQLTERLRRAFGDHMGVYHSRFPDRDRVALWQRQLTPEAFPLLLGVRSALFLPFQKLGLIIVDEEHETSYKQVDPAPRYGARDTAILLAARCGAHVLLGSATPSVETYHNAQTGKYGLVEMKQRFAGVQLPRVLVADVRDLRRRKLMPTPFAPVLIDLVRQALAEGRQAILFQNRRGYAPVLECPTCGWTPRCTRCDVSLTLHQRAGRLVCHYCGAQFDLPKQCPACGDTHLRDIGFGTEKIEAAAQTVFPEARIERMDLDTTRSRTAYERIIRRFSRGETNLLIGTQMVTKGLDFERVRVVGILNADQQLSVPDFRAYERAYQMLAQVAGRAGRRGEQGTVVLQTKQADHPVVQQVVENNYRALYEQTLAERMTYGFPPACRLIAIILRHRTEAVVSHAADHLAALLRPHFPEGLLGPDRPVVARVQMLFIRKILVKVPHTFTPDSVRRTLTAARDAVLAYPVYKSVRVHFDVDP